MLKTKRTWLRTLGLIGALGCCVHGAAVADVYATPGGAELSMIQTNPGNVFQGTAKRVSN
jgi:hypothetical protein